MPSSYATVCEEFILEAGQCMDVPVGLVHQMEALEDSQLYEFSSQHFESDSYSSTGRLDLLFGLASDQGFHAMSQYSSEVGSAADLPLSVCSSEYGSVVLSPVHL
jgi:hypothetical protein